MTDVPKVCLVVDYQNIHLMAHQIWAPWGLPVHEALIHPLKFAEQVMAVRSIRQQDPLQQQALLTSVRVFRGAPSNKKQPYLYGISQRQQSAWTRDKRVEVTYRTLRYPQDWPKKPAREKDVDVLVALTLMRAAQEPDVDVVILASHDSDLEPALERCKRAASEGATTRWLGQLEQVRPHHPLIIQQIGSG